MERIAAKPSASQMNSPDRYASAMWTDAASVNLDRPQIGGAKIAVRDGAAWFMLKAPLRNLGGYSLRHARIEKGEA